MITDIIIPIIAGLGGSLIGIHASNLSQKREYKSILLLLIQEYMLLLERSAMYYAQFIRGPVSFSSLFQISDSNTFLKLAQLCSNTECLKAALELKASFFQVEKHVQRAAGHMFKFTEAQIRGHEPLATEEFKNAKNAQSMAINFFVGDQAINKIFFRKKYFDYLKSIKILIAELKRQNERKSILNLLQRKNVIGNFFDLESQKLILIEKKISTIRNIEEILFNKNHEMK